FMGDVWGRGGAASLLMPSLNGIFRSLLPSHLPLNHLVERANRLFSRSTSSAHFATLVSGRASHTGEVEISNAGHCFPLVIHRGQIRSIESTGLPLGMFFSAEYQSRKVQLERGDTLFLYTDGLTESRNASNDEYSEARLHALVAREHQRSAEDLIAACVADLTEFRGGTARVDDLTLMVMRRV